MDNPQSMIIYQMLNQAEYYHPVTGIRERECLQM